MKYRALLLILFSTVSASSLSELIALDDEALSLSTGQALVKIEEESHTQANGQVYDFNKITMGLKMELNANIDRISLGRYNRGNGVNCDSHGAFCDNSSGTYKAWNCSVATCGGVRNDGSGNDSLSVSPLIYGDLYAKAGIDYNILALTLDVLAKNHYSYSHKFDSSNGEKIFKSGFNYTQDTDLALHDVTLGRIKDNADGTQTLENFVFEKPFFEFAYNQTGKIVGLRTGFGTADGVQGNAIDVFSGFVQPVVTANVRTAVGAVDFSFAPYLGGVRTPGYIHPTKTEIVRGCSGNFLVCPSVETPAKIAEASPQAQLFPLQALELKKSPTMWLSLQSEDVNYPDKVIKRINSSGVEEEVRYKYETAKAGVWFNLGALSVHADGSKVNITNIAEYTGLAVNTNKPLHPDNYFNAHPNNNKYPQSYNYY